MGRETGTGSQEEVTMHRIERKMLCSLKSDEINYMLTSMYQKYCIKMTLCSITAVFNVVYWIVFEHEIILNKAHITPPPFYITTVKIP